MPYTLRQGEALEVLRELESASAHALVTDPPAGVSFMGREWDSDRGGRAQWVAWLAEILAEARRVLRPGAHALVWALPRTAHWTACALEDAGFEVRDVVTHLFGQGFPKSTRVNRDPRFCPCAAAVRNVESRALGPLLEVHSGTGDAAWDDGPPPRDALHSMRRPAGFQVDCLPADGCDGAPSRRVEEHGRAPARSRVCAPVHTHSLGPADAPASAPVDTPCPARCSSPPSNLDSVARGTSESDAGARMPASTTRSAGGAIQTAGEAPPPRTQRTVSESDPREEASFGIGLPICAGCGKPQAEGFGTALKPAAEFWILARAPLVGTVAANVLEHGCGALNIDACRIATTDSLGGGAEKDRQADKPEGWDRPWRHDPARAAAHAGRIRANVAHAEALGRWPANVVLSGDAPALLDAQSPEGRPGERPAHCAGMGYHGGANGIDTGVRVVLDSGGPSRFFYCAKASRAERGEWNHHPCVKPLELMRWLVRLVTPPGGLVLDPFAGSGTTVLACLREGFACFAIERDPDSVRIARARLGEEWAEPEPEPEAERRPAVARQGALFG